MPRISRTFSQGRASTFWPSNVTVPCSMNAPRREYARSAVPAVVLPEPDSPTSPTTSPGRSSMLISSTTSRLVPVSATRRSETVQPAVWFMSSRDVSFTSVTPAGKLRDTVGHQVGADREDTDDDHGSQDAPRLDQQRESVLVDHLAPFGRIGVGGEAQEPDARDEADRVGEPQPRLGQQRRIHVRQHLG